jgi:hypothetical protein
MQASAPFTGYDDGLPCAVLAHGRVRIFSNGEQMRLEIAPSSPRVCLDNLGTIHRNALKWIDGNEDDTGICIDAVLGITIADGV